MGRTRQAELRLGEDMLEPAGRGDEAVGVLGSVRVRGRGLELGLGLGLGG